MADEQQKLGRIDRKKIDTRNRIIDTTVRLIQTKGFDGTTMEQIAEETDIAKKTLYNYYPEKEAILSDYIRRTFETKNAFRIPHLKTLGNTRTRMVYILNNLMDGVRAQKEIFEKYLVYIMKQVVNFDAHEGSNSGIGALISETIRLGMQEGDICSDFPPAVLQDFFIFIFIETAKQYYADPAGYQQNEVIESSVDLFLNGVKPAVI